MKNNPCFDWPVAFLRSGYSTISGEMRIPATAFLRPFNVLGWAAIAIGDLQLIAPRDEIVLGAAPALEPGSLSEPGS